MFLQLQRAQHLAAVTKTVQREFAEELQDLSALGVEAKLRAKLESLQQKTQLLNEESSAVASSLQEVFPATLTLIVNLVS